MFSLCINHNTNPISNEHTQTHSFKRPVLLFLYSLQIKDINERGGSVCDKSAVSLPVVTPFDKLTSVLIENRSVCYGKKTKSCKVAFNQSTGFVSICLKTQLQNLNRLYKILTPHRNKHAQTRGFTSHFELTYQRVLAFNNETSKNKSEKFIIQINCSTYTWCACRTTCSMTTSASRLPECMD